MFSNILANFLRYPKATTWLTLAVYLLVGFGITNSYCPCIGEDGHGAVETAINDCCNQHPVIFTQLANQSYTENAISSADHPSDDNCCGSCDDHCGSCINMPLVPGEFRYSPDSPKVPSIQKQRSVQADLVHSVPVEFESTALFSDPVNKPPKNPTLISLSKIILLI
jgi:hypothetical protein